MSWKYLSRVANYLSAGNKVMISYMYYLKCEQIIFKKDWTGNYLLGFR